MNSMKSRKIGLSIILLFVMILGGSIMAQDKSTIPQRSDIPDKYKWRVEDIYETIDDWNADYDRIEAGLGEYEKFKGHLADSPEMLYQCLRLDDSLNVIIGNLYVYAYLKWDEDQRVSTYQELSGRASGINSRMSQAEAFIQPEILAMDDEKIMSFIEQYEGLKIYEFYLKDMIRQKTHILSQEGERIMAAAAGFTRTPIDIFQIIDNVDHKLGKVVDSAGDTIALTWGRYSRIMKGTDRELRRVANDTVQESWKRYINTLSKVLYASVVKDLFITEARNYNSTLSRGLDGNNIPEDVFYNLIQTITANLEPLHKWYDIKKRVLGYDTMYAYDMSVPVAPDYEKQFEFEEAEKLVLAGMKPLGKQYVKDLEMGMNGGWIDAFEYEGKSSGGYNWGTYTSHPYIMMNFDKNLRDVFTLAHELGHAIHGLYTNRNEPYIYHGHSLFNAEIASTTNEALLQRYMLDNAKNRMEKISLLNNYIEQIEGTVFVQVMFSEFEQIIHDQVQNGGAFSVDWLRQEYRKLQDKYYGPAVTIGPDNDMSGMKIYHFYRTFYVYQYATGYCAAEALAHKILAQEEGALENYKEFLSTGTSDYPVEILKKAGVDMTKPEAVEATMKLFAELVNEIEKLLHEEGMI